MQENEFEKRLQEEMSEFRVRPSDVVWDKIEEDLRKKKRRRIVFYVFLLAGLSVVGYSGYFLFSPKKQILTEQEVAKTEKNEHEKQEPSGPNHDAGKANPVNETTEQQIQSTNAENDSPAEIKIPENDARKVDREARQPSNRSNALKISKPSTKANPGSPKDNIPNTRDQTARQNKENIDTVENPVKIPEADPAKSDLKTDDPVTSEKKQTNAADPDSAIAAIKKQEQELPTNQPKSVKKNSSLIRWGFELSAGISQLGNNAFSFSVANRQADALYVNTPGNNTGGNTGNVNFYYPPSEILSGAAFRAAVLGEMSITKRSSVSAGLGYAYYSNEIKTGVYKDSSFVLRTMAAQSVNLDAYYQGSQVMEYRNKYHFIQVPINYQLQLNKGVKLPIIWSVGVAPSYLFSTNALVYDTATGGIYYKNNDAFNKFHFNLNTGISFRVGKPGKLQWSIGPELSMDMTGLAKDADQKRYFLYGGINGRVYFKKKNTK